MDGRRSSAGRCAAAASFAPGVGSDIEQQLLYLAVDMFLLLGLLGFYELRHQDAGRTGALGSCWRYSAWCVVRSSRAIPGLDLYPLGALAFVGGLIVPVWQRVECEDAGGLGARGVRRVDTRWARGNGRGQSQGGYSSCLACCLAPLLPDSDARCGQQPGDFDRGSASSAPSLLARHRDGAVPSRVCRFRQHHSRRPPLR